MLDSTFNTLTFLLEPQFVRTVSWVAVSKMAAGNTLPGELVQNVHSTTTYVFQLLICSTFVCGKLNVQTFSLHRFMLLSLLLFGLKKIPNPLLYFYNETLTCLYLTPTAYIKTTKAIKYFHISPIDPFELQSTPGHFQPTWGGFMGTQPRDSDPYKTAGAYGRHIRRKRIILERIQIAHDA